MLVASLAILLVGLGAFPQEPLRRFAEARLKAAAGDGSGIGGLRVVPFLLRAQLSDLRLEGPGYRLDVPEARVVLAPRALAGALALRRLEVESPVLLLSPDGEDDAEDGTLAAPPPIEIGALAIRDARVRWADPATGELRLSGISAEGAVGSGQLTIDAPRGAWQGETTREVGPLHAVLSVSRELDVVLDSSEVRVGASILRARGPLVRRGEVLLDVDMEADVDLEGGGATLGRPELSGVLEAEGRLEGASDGVRLSLAVEGRAAWDQWSVDDITLHLGVQPLAGRARARLEGRVLGGLVEGEARGLPR